MKLYHTDCRFCVYFFRRKDNLEIVYVGHGTEKRPYSKTGRSQTILSLMNENTIQVIVAFDFLTKNEAEIIEGEYLTEYLNKKTSGFNLLNQKPKRSPVKVVYADISKHLAYDKTSETFLVWKNDRYAWNGALITKCGSVAGCRDKLSGYVKLKINGIQYKGHRLVYCLANKTDLDENLVIDHIDRDKFNNNSENLRIVSHQENSRNKIPTKQSNNKTGNIGVILWDDTKGSLHFKATCTYTVNRKSVLKSKTFSISKYGEQEAFRLACEARKQFEAERDLALSMQSN